MSRPEKAHAWRKKQGADIHSKIHEKKTTKNMTDNQQANLKEPSHLLHCTTQRTRARLFLERGAAFFPPFPQLSGEYYFEFEFEFARRGRPHHFQHEQKSVSQAPKHERANPGSRHIRRAWHK